MDPEKKSKYWKKSFWIISWNFKRFLQKDKKNFKEYKSERNRRRKKVFEFQKTIFAFLRKKKFSY